MCNTTALIVSLVSATLFHALDNSRSFPCLVRLLLVTGNLHCHPKFIARYQALSPLSLAQLSKVGLTHLRSQITGSADNLPMRWRQRHESVWRTREREKEKDPGRIMTVKGSWLCHWLRGKPRLLCATRARSPEPAIGYSSRTAAKSAAEIGNGGFPGIKCHPREVKPRRDYVEAGRLIYDDYS